MSVQKSILELAKGMRKAKVISDEQMKKFEALCKPEKQETKKTTLKKLTPNEIKKIRLQVKVKPKEFAECLNITPQELKAWETGKTSPKGTAIKLLSLVAKKGLKALDC